MGELIKKFKLYGIKKFFHFAFNELRYMFFSQHILGSYSQNGEDLIMYKFLKSKRNGFYVDIGAYDPNRFSNTKYFYDKGWSGINIEPENQRYKKLVSVRVRDINLNIGVGVKQGNVMFYRFLPDSLSTFSSKQAKIYEKIGFKVESKSRMKIQRLDYILQKYCKKKVIDFLSIDTEGFEMEVLKSNNWRKFKPRIICIESYTFNTKHSPTFRTKQPPSVERIEIKNFLTKYGYKKVYANSTNIIYQILT